MNYESGTIAEIKPLSLSGVSGGYVQLHAALNMANGVEWQYNGEDFKTRPVPNLAGKPWTKEKWSPGIQALLPSTVDPYWKDDVIVTLGNFDGL